MKHIYKYIYKSFNGKTIQMNIEKNTVVKKYFQKRYIRLTEAMLQIFKFSTYK